MPEWHCAFVPAWVSCISCFYFQHANQGMHFAYCKLLWSIIHGRDSMYVSFSLRGHGLLRTSHRDFLNLQNFFFTSGEQKSWHLLWAFPRSAWKAARFLFFLHYCRNAMKMYLLTIKIETVWTSHLFGKGSSNFSSNHFSSSLKWKYSLSLFAAELFVVLFSGLQRGYFFPRRYTSQQNLISSASVEFTLPILIEG